MVHDDEEAGEPTRPSRRWGGRRTRANPYGDFTALGHDSLELGEGPMAREERMRAEERAAEKARDAERASTGQGKGGFREALDLTGILDRYSEHLGKDGEVNYVIPGTLREREEEAFEPIPQHLYAQPPGSAEHPEVVGDGPLTASTSRVLALARPLFAWDPNRYYRRLGIAWPYVHATRGQLARAFSMRGDDPMAAYAFKQLLNHRAEYDAMPLGKQFLNDVYVQQERKRKAAEEVERRHRMGDTDVTVDDILEEQGDLVRLTPEEEAEIERLRALDETASNDDSVGGPWQYAFYLWRTTTYDVAALQEWQEALIREIGGNDFPALVVGMMGKQPHRFAIAEVGDHTVVFLNRDLAPTPDLVEAATSALRTIFADMTSVDTEREQ